MMTSKNSNGAAKAGAVPRTVSPARLQQKTGSVNAFGGYEKVKHSNNTFSMRARRSDSEVGKRLVRIATNGGPGRGAIHRKEDASPLDEVIRLLNVVEFRFNV